MIELASALVTRKKNGERNKCTHSDGIMHTLNEWCDCKSNVRMNLTSLKLLNMFKPSSSSTKISIILARTIKKSKIFQPLLKYSLDRANTLIMHSNAKIDENTCMMKRIA